MRNAKLFLPILCLLGAVQLSAMEIERGDNDQDLCSMINKLYEMMGEEKVTQESVQKQIDQAKTDEELMRLLIRDGDAKQVSTPWKQKYSEESRKSQAASVEKKCPFCEQCSHPENDDSNFFIERGDETALLINLWGIGLIHFLCVPFAHKKNLGDLSKKNRHELFRMSAGLIKKTKKYLKIRGFKMFLNLSDKCAGATLPDHLHVQLQAEFEGSLHPLARQIMIPLHRAERQGGYFKEFKPGGDLKRLEPIYAAFSTILTHPKLFKKEQISQVKKDKKCGICLMIDGKSKFASHVLKKTKHFTLLYNPVGANHGEVFIVTSDCQKSLDALDENQNNELSDLTAEVETVIKEVTGAHGISISVADGIAAKENPFSHQAVMKVTPRWANEWGTIGIHYGEKIDSMNRSKEFEKLKTAFNIKE